MTQRQFHPTAAESRRSTDAIQCPGCHTPVDVSRPPGVDFDVLHNQTIANHPTVIITVGRIVVHRCWLCADGTWR